MSRHSPSGVVSPNDAAPRRSWTDLIDQLYSGSWDPNISRFRSPYVFRGHPSLDYALTTRLFRLAERRNVGALELSLLRNFRKYAHGQMRGRDDSIWYWL